VSENAEDLIVRNLTEAVNRLNADPDRVAFWTDAFAAFQAAVPHYHPGSDFLLPPRRPAKHST
jgi:hypothetical protein